jgi:hypothetical protein
MRAAAQARFETAASPQQRRSGTIELLNDSRSILDHDDGCSPAPSPRTQELAMHPDHPPPTSLWTLWFQDAPNRLPYC